MSFDLEKFINYKAHDVPSSRIASALGVSDSHISRLSAKSKIKELVTLRKGELALAQIEERTTLAVITEKLLLRMVDLADTTENLTEATRTFLSLRSLHSEGIEQGERQGQRGAISVVVPIFLSESLSLAKNSANEIIEIEGRSMATAPASTILTLASPSPHPSDTLTLSEEEAYGLALSEEDDPLLSSNSTSL